MPTIKRSINSLISEVEICIIFVKSVIINFTLSQLRIQFSPFMSSKIHACVTHRSERDRKSSFSNEKANGSSSLCVSTLIPIVVVTCFLLDIVFWFIIISLPAPFHASKSISFAEFFPTWKREIQALSSSPMHDSSPLLPPLSSGHLTQCSQALHIPLPSYRTV